MTRASGIITLTTDFGLSDPYVAMMKGVILSINPKARLIDLSHDISPGGISQAAAFLLETYPYYPQGSVHMAVIDPGVGTSRRPIGIESGGHFFVGPDNGLFSPIIEKRADPRIIHLTEKKYFQPLVSKTFHGRDIFAPVAAHLSLGIGLDSMGPAITNPVQLKVSNPYEKDGVLYGQVTRIDRFGNLQCNIHRTELMQFLESKEPTIKVGKLVINKLSHTYGDQDVDNPLALMDNSDFLEIAVNQGKASEAVGITAEALIGSQVKIEKD